MADEIQRDRRFFLGSAAMSVAAAKLGVFGSLGTRLHAVASGSATPLVASKQIDAGPLSVAYVEAGPTSGTPVVLLHGWPYDIQSFAAVAPALASSGYRVIVPFLRGYGSTRFRSMPPSRRP